MEEKEDDVLPHLNPVPGTELRFTQFPERHFPEGSTPAEITHHSLDSTYVLETMGAKYTRCVFSCSLAKLVYVNSNCTGFINLKTWHVILLCLVCDNQNHLFVKGKAIPLQAQAGP
jgi:hypothetical protein